MRILLKEIDRLNRRRVTLLDERWPRGKPLALRTSGEPLALSESSQLVFRLFLHQAHPGFQARVYVGGALVASTRDVDRADYPLLPLFEDAGPEGFGCTGFLLRDWVGQTDLRVEVSTGGPWLPVLRVGLNVAAGKMEQEAFEALCAELANHSAALLLDVYGKTFVGLEAERQPGEQAPLLVLTRVRQALDQMAACLREVAHQPAYRLKAQRVREPALAGQSVSDVTLEEVCRDPTLAARSGSGIIFREHVREVAVPTYDRPENRVLAGFLRFVGRQLADLRSRLHRERQLRLDRRAFRHRRTAEGVKSWWEQEDLPRIAELDELLGRVAAMERDLADQRRSPFLPAAPTLNHVPTSTPLFRHHKAYARAFKVMTAHYQAYRIQLDDAHLVLRARSLPVLYEWWCALEVARCLQGCLSLTRADAADRSSPFRCLEDERSRFVVELGPNQVMDFGDANGRRVRLRYVPSYRAPGRDGMPYGLLGLDDERTPDLALEIYPAGAGPEAVPELIVVLDAKYSSASHYQKLVEVQRKYGKIGLFRTGTVLSRQVWALSPSPPSGRGPAHPEWASFCTVDNHAFWSEHFDLGSTVTGVVQAKPNLGTGRTPLDQLLRLILKRSGVAVR